MSLGTTQKSLDFPFPKFRRAEANFVQERLRTTSQVDALEVGDLWF